MIPPYPEDHPQIPPPLPLSVAKTILFINFLKNIRFPTHFSHQKHPHEPSEHPPPRSWNPSRPSTRTTPSRSPEHSQVLNLSLTEVGAKLWRITIGSLAAVDFAVSGRWWFVVWSLRGELQCFPWATKSGAETEGPQEMWSRLGEDMVDRDIRSPHLRMAASDDLSQHEYRTDQHTSHRHYDVEFRLKDNPDDGELHNLENLTSLLIPRICIFNILCFTLVRPLVLLRRFI